MPQILGLPGKRATDICAANEALAESWLLWRPRSFVSIPFPLNVRPTIAAMSCCVHVECRCIVHTSQLLEGEGAATAGSA